MKKVQLVDDEERVIWMKAVTDEEWERILRILELTKDSEALPILDRVINELEAPKKNVALKIAKKISEAKNLEEVLSKALMALPTKDLEQMSESLETIEIEPKLEFCYRRSFHKGFKD